jgi:hypothetical protein
MVTTQEPVPEHAPVQPVKVEPDFGVAVRVTIAPGANLCVQVDPQLIPAGLLSTVPLPFPALTTVRSFGGANFAVVARAAVIVS